MTELVIRRATLDDAHFLLPLIDRAGEGLPVYFWDQVAEPGQSGWAVGLARVQSEDAGISYKNAWIAELGGRPSGCLIAYQKTEEAEEIDEDMPPMLRPIVELENLAVGTGYVYILSAIAEMRGRGIGTSLLSFAEKFRGPNGMSLIIADNNTRARALYERHGYHARDSRAMIKNGWQSDGNNWVLMIKE